MENYELEKREEKMSFGIWKIIGGAAAILFVAGVIANLQDIRRYLKISRM